LIFLLITIPSIGLAQSNTIPTVIVTAPRISADSIDTDFQTSSVTVISKDEFDTKVATVADILKKETGIQIRQSGGLGSFSTVNIRGSSSRQVNVYLDGVLLNGAFGGSVDLSQFALGNVESIEIYRGNAPVQLGFSGIGGAINIKTRKLQGEPLKQLTLGVGSFESKKLAVSVADSYLGNEFFVSAEYLAADNDFDIVNQNGTFDNPRDDFVEKRNNADFNHTSGLFSINRSINEFVNAKLITQFFDKEDKLANSLNTEDNRAKLETVFLSTQVKLDYFYQPGVSYGFKLFSSEKTEFFQDDGDLTGLEANKEEGTTLTYGSVLQSSFSLDSHLLNLNLESKVEKYSLIDFKLSNTFKYKRTQNILGLQDEWLSPDGKWVVSISGRLFYIVDKSEQGNVDKSDWETNLSAGALYTINDTVQLRANISSAIRTPQLFELYGDRGYFKGNADLVPENAINYDAGLLFTTQNSKTSASIFYRSLTDAIVNVFGSQGTGKAFNIAKAKVMGLELDTFYKINGVWSVSTKSTLQDSENLSKGPDTNGNSLAGLYTLSNFAMTSVLLRSTTYTLEYRHQSGGFYDASNDAVIPDQNVVNLSAKWQNKSSSLELRIDNFSDKLIEDFNRFSMPGRHFFIVYKQNF